jgi:hypothetical protein
MRIGIPLSLCWAARAQTTTVVGTVADAAGTHGRCGLRRGRRS